MERENKVLVSSIVVLLTMSLILSSLWMISVEGKSDSDPKDNLEVDQEFYSLGEDVKIEVRNDGSVMNSPFYHTLHIIDSESGEIVYEPTEVIRPTVPPSDANETLVLKQSEDIPKEAGDYRVKWSTPQHNYSANFNIVESLQLEIISPEDGKMIENRSTVEVRWSGAYAENYEIRLDEDDWLDLGKNESYVFENPSTGEHTVKVRAMGAEGLTIEENVTFTVESENEVGEETPGLGLQISISAVVVAALIYWKKSSKR